MTVDVDDWPTVEISMQLLCANFKALDDVVFKSEDIWGAKSDRTYLTHSWRYPAGGHFLGFIHFNAIVSNTFTLYIHPSLVVAQSNLLNAIARIVGVRSSSHRRLRTKNVIVEVCSKIPGTYTCTAPMVTLPCIWNNISIDQEQPPWYLISSNLKRRRNTYNKLNM